MLTLYDEFSGIGGTSQGAANVPGVQVALAANHDPHAIKSHALNFPDAVHYEQDVTKLDVSTMPRADIFTASPACPAWTDANGVRRDFDKVNAEQGALFSDEELGEDPKLSKRREQYRRSRLLMQEIPRYLSAVAERYPSRPVLAGLVENVIQCRLWSEWDRWVGEIQALGYETRVIAFNAMHARPRRARRAPQSRDRLVVAYWHRSLGRRPDFDKWLRPQAYCRRCDAVVDAVQQFKRTGQDMGRYRAQYIYRCPIAGHGEVIPAVAPASEAIDPSLPGSPIGGRAKPLVDATLERLRAGILRYWAPLLVPAGGTWRTAASPLSEPMPTRTTRECDGLATLPGFVIPLRGGGDRGKARPVSAPLSTVTASGNHHGLAFPPLITRQNSGHPESRTTPAHEPMRAVTANGTQSLMSLAVPYYGQADTARPVTDPFGALTTRDRYGVASAADLSAAAEQISLDEVLFRMLEPHEQRAAMAFADTTLASTTVKKTLTRLYGNAVPPPMSEVIVSALVEAITGEAVAA